MQFEIRREKLNDANIAKIVELSRQNIYACYQCGMCTASCPSSENMDIPPNMIVRLIQVGMVDRVLDSRSIWVCTSCFTCFAECPKGIDIASLTEALRLYHLRRNIDHLDLSSIPRGELLELPVIAMVSALRKFTA